ncbi:SRPBCC family protein [Actinomadura latina]|uniref:Molecular chaperone Hsp90 n=1 Tax=Actinomadura latina TaxID=163603 RepID=A0A846Z5P9_9ACTN|nr:SRPBCC family protein [Actinomadura latina]NKZ05733.1 molecular chaperone Hsp90 [Actinomadura latina]
MPSLATLHDEYALRGRIDESAPVTNTSSVLIDASPARVWDVLADLRGWETWAPGFRLRALDAVEPGREFRWTQNGTPLRSRFAVVDPGRELSWTGSFLARYRAVDRLVLAEEDGRTRVTVQESLDGPLVHRVYPPHKLRAGHETRLAALKDHLETRA